MGMSEEMDKLYGTRRDADKLADLLRKTAAAHHEYEQALGRPDEDWATWYAHFMVLQG